jgi:5-methylcytosine-specific restriction endonuclease McrA
VTTPIPTSDEQILFLRRLQRLLSEGSFYATYKFALLLSIADLCIDRIGLDDGGELELATRDIAEKFIQLYWRQAAPYPVPGSSPLVLVQTPGKQTAVIRRLLETREQFGSLPKLRAQKVEWKQLVTQVNATVKMMPLWKLQTIGKKSEPGQDFLYENAGKGNSITLRPGVAYCFRQYYWLLSDLVRGAWLRHVRKFNEASLGDQDLADFLWGTDRANLEKYVKLLKEPQNGNCFYCNRGLGDSIQVDHFIPWSRYPVDLGHNFVLAHATCNNGKSDHLAAEDHLAHWVDFTDTHGEELASEFTSEDLFHDLNTSRHVAAWAYDQLAEVGGKAWAQGGGSNRLFVPLSNGWRSLLT